MVIRNVMAYHRACLMSTISLPFSCLFCEFQPYSLVLSLISPILDVLSSLRAFAHAPPTFCLEEFSHCLVNTSAMLSPFKVGSPHQAHICLVLCLIDYLPMEQHDGRSYNCLFDRIIVSLTAVAPLKRDAWVWGSLNAHSSIARTQQVSNSKQTFRKHLG